MPKVRSRWHTQHTRLTANSDFHNILQTVFTEDPFFSKLRCYQEVPVSDLCDGYHNRSHRFDWYIEELEVIIELHGTQHYKMSNRGGIGAEQAHRAFKAQRGRDSIKKQAALDAGYKYVEIPYKLKHKLDAALLKKLLFESNDDEAE
jgi:hypothetical protein